MIGAWARASASLGTPRWFMTMYCSCRSENSSIIRTRRFHASGDADWPSTITANGAGSDTIRIGGSGNVVNAGAGQVTMANLLAHAIVQRQKGGCIVQPARFNVHRGCAQL